MDARLRAYPIPPHTPATSPAAGIASGFRSALGALAVLVKLRVVMLLMLSSIGGALLASGGRLAAGNMVLLLVTGFLSATGASALNQYLERDLDARMRRTCKRPLPIGYLSRPEAVLEAGIYLIFLAVLIALPFNVMLTLFLTLGALTYVGIYTMWLKSRTLLNIVIGGAAGSFAVFKSRTWLVSWVMVPLLSHCRMLLRKNSSVKSSLQMLLYFTPILVSDPFRFNMPTSPGHSPLQLAIVRIGPRWLRSPCNK